MSDPKPPLSISRRLIEEIRAGDLLIHVTSDTEGRPVEVRASLEGKEILGPVEGEVVERIAKVLELQRGEWGREVRAVSFRPGIVCPKHGYADVKKHPLRSWEEQCAECAAEEERAREQEEEDKKRPDLDAPKSDPHDEPRAKTGSDDIPF